MVVIRVPDPEYAEPFRAYSNYMVDLASEIGGHFGWGRRSLVEGVMDGVSLHLDSVNIDRRRLDPRAESALRKSMTKSWANLRRLRREVDDIDSFDEDTNAWLPVQAYYAVYDAVRSLTIASNQHIPREHRKALNLASKAVQRGRFPYPWSMYCDGCPQTGSHSFPTSDPPGSVHVLSNPDPDTAVDRLAMFLRTTRMKELERRFSEDRKKKVAPGRQRRNLSVEDKEAIAARLAPTTVFDLFWRLRMKANYDDADTFVLGAGDVADARAFADSLAIVTDASVAAIEGVVVAYVGADLVGDFASSYQEKVRTDAGSPIAVRAALLGSYISAQPEAPF